jgi:hypothetical protein
MKKLSLYFYKKSSLALALIFTAIMFAYFAFVFLPAGKGFEVEGGTLALGLSFGLPYELVQTFFAARTEEMIQSYIEFNTIWDNIFALLYGLVYVVWISLIFKPISSKFKVLNLLPFVQTICDWGENFCLVDAANSVLANEGISGGIIQVGSIFSISKWSVSGLIFLAIGIGLILRIIWVLKGKKSK